MRVARGLDDLPPPSPGELETLKRIKAPGFVRLACQLRPSHDVSVVPLLSAGVDPHSMGTAIAEGHELQVTVLFTDLRDSTRLAAGHLPFDALFIIDCYVQRVTVAVQANGSYVTSVAGNGIMSVSAVGSTMLLGRPTLQFLGDTGNVAARLDALTKEMGCTLIVSARVFDVAGREAPWGVRQAEVVVRGREEAPLAVMLLERLDEARLLARQGASAASG